MNHRFSERLRRWRQRGLEPGFIRAAHYFGDGWPINCWSGMQPRKARKDFRAIREDGFNTVILVVPWRGFQVRQFPPVYEESYFRRLRQLLREARRAGLWVYLRVSYSHHICDQAPLISKHLTSAFLTDESYRAPWLHYLDRLHRETRRHVNLRGYFLCWEEFWHGLMRFSQEPEQPRAQLAQRSGYAAWLGDADAEVPAPADPEFERWQRFINLKLREILELGNTAMPGLGFEFRVDKDPVHRPDGSLEWLDNDSFMDLEGLRFSYWAPFIGAANRGELLTAEQAEALLEYSLREQTGAGRHTGLIVDQFNFVDDTFKYAGQHARLEPGEVPDFLSRCAELLPRYCAGYGIWAWRDYVQNHLFNPGFDLGWSSWQRLAGRPVRSRRGIKLRPGDEIGQDFGGASHGMHRKFRTDEVTLRVQLARATEARLEAALDGENYVSLAPGEEAQVMTCTLPIDDPVYGSRGVLFRLRAVAGVAHIRHLSLYQYAYRVGIRAVDGSAGPYLAPLRELNRRLAEQGPGQAVPEAPIAEEGGEA